MQQTQHQVDAVEAEDETFLASKLFNAGEEQEVNKVVSHHDVIVAFIEKLSSQTPVGDDQVIVFN